MPSKQEPIGSGYGPRTTAAEVLANRNLSGKLAIVTGGYSGLGLETTRALAHAGAHVVIGARRPDIARRAVSEMRNVEVDELDLADLESVRRFADRFLSTQRHGHILINNAAIMACPETRVGPGWEAQLATNHLGHFALVNRLWPALAGGARVVAVSSSAHRMGMHWDDMQFRQGYDKWLAYGQSKAANVLFAVHLDRLGQSDNVRTFALHPGFILTPLQRHLPKAEMIAAGWIDADGNLADARFKTPAQGAATQVWAATAPELDGMGGLYCEDCDIAPLAVGNGPGVLPAVLDAEAAARLWEMSAALTGVNAFAASR